MPVYNAVATVGRAIGSILEQSEEDLELIVIDDGSADGSAGVIEEAIGGDPRVRSERHPTNLGVVAAANHGHRLARSGLVARMDADDWSHPERLRKQAEFLFEHPDCAVCGTLIRVTGGIGGRVGDGFRRFESWVNGLTGHESMMAERFIETPIVQPSVMMRRKVFEVAGGYRDCPWAEDYDLWLRLFEDGCRFGKVEEVLLEWRDGSERLTRSDPRYRQAMFLSAKASYIGKLPCAKQHGISICGAGDNGKRLANLFRDGGVRVERFYDVHPRRIGKKINGVEVFGRDALPAAGDREPLLLSAVGVPGGRAEVREFAVERGYAEGESFFCLI